MKHLVLGLLTASLAAAAVTAANPPPPNILLVVADDHARWAAAPYGHPFVETPTLDFLAASGLMALNAGSVSPVCSPSRASLLSGRLPSQHGVHDFIREDPTFARDWLAGELLLPGLLEDAGYRTALMGKWHLNTDSSSPVAGFERWLSYDVRTAGWQTQYRHRGAVHLSDDGRPRTVDGFQTAQLIDAAIDFVAEPDDRPWFLLFAPTDTHAPHEGLPERWVERYRRLLRHHPPVAGSTHLPLAAAQFAAAADLPEQLAQYLAAVSHQDAQLGRLLDALDSRGELDRTLVIYTSDHGLMVGQHGLVGKANATLPQNLYEEVVRVPLLLRLPDRIPAGTVFELPVDQLDLFWTILDTAGVELAPATAARINSAGRSLLAHLADPQLPWREHRFAEHGNLRMVADGRSKLLRRYPPLDPRFGDELYDLVVDPGEMHNLIADPAYRHRRETLQTALDEFFRAHETAATSGLDALQQPPCNGREPWRRMEQQPASAP